MLLGSDAFRYVAGGAWENSDVLYDKVRLIVAPRIGQDISELESLQAAMPKNAKVAIITTENNHAASSDIRHALIKGNAHDAHLSSLSSYIKQNWLYCSVAGESL